ncbi:MAG: sulfite exporter TauE/SafE family protein, partial [Vicinamibacterales bacterium]
MRIIASPTVVLIVMAAGAGAGSLGALLGIGGGVFLVPFLNLAIGLPFLSAAGISLMTVIATSSAVSARSSGRQLINLRLGMVLEVATVVGAFVGSLTVGMLSDRQLQRLFAAVTAAIALLMLTRLDRRNVILDPAADPGTLGGRYYEQESGADVTYRVRRLPLGLGVSFVAGVLSILLGIGGGTLKVPALNAWCGVPMRAAAATSAFMIGVTALAGALKYYVRGDIRPELAAAAVLGVLAGSRVGFLISDRARAKGLKALMAVVLAGVA